MALVPALVMALVMGFCDGVESSFGDGFGEGFDNFESPDQDPTDMIEDYEFDRISEIEDEIRQLRLEAREIDPKYDEFIKRMDDFYEFDINRN
jgi:hypothetical protein